ncbi:hypothetical protein EBR56_10365, partial [bacterium]|nr:hypothetical protein [bacterium]
MHPPAWPPRSSARGVDARSLTASWRDEYNTQRPHSSLGYRTP